MRIYILLTLVVVFSANATSTYSQNTRLSMSLKGATIKQVIKEIEQNSEYIFIYHDDVIDETRKVNIEVSGQPVEAILDKVFSQTDNNYRVVDRQIVIGKREVHPLDRVELAESRPTQIVVQGKILDGSTRQPMPGVNIYLKNSTTGTISNIDGEYTISVLSSESVLIFSFIGYESREVIVGNQTRIDVILQEEIAGLDEVVVIGYGATKRADLTSSIAIVRAEEIAKQPVMNFSQALQGKAAGVTVVQSGAPGSSASIRIRGTNSINNTEPLYVVDGIIGAGAPNPQDIESIQILKDAASAAIYGSRGSNGVIIITTKKGKEGAPSVNIRSFMGVQQIDSKIKLLTGDQFIQYWESNRVIDEMRDESGNKLFPNDYSISHPTRVDSALAYPGSMYNANTDWLDEIYRTALMHNLNVSVSGGTDQLKYFVSLDNRNQDGVQINSGYSANSLRVSTEYSKGRLSIGENINIYRNNRGNNGSRTRIAMRQSPLLPVYNPNSTDDFTKWAGNTGLDNSNNPNPVAQIKEAFHEGINEGLQTSLYAEVKLLPGLLFRSNFATRLGNTTNTSKNYRYSDGAQVNDKTTLNVYTERFVHTQLENTLTYQKVFRMAHALTAVAGYTREFEQFRSTNTFARGFQVKDPVSFGSREANSQIEIGGGFSEAALESYLGRVMYDYKGKYLVTGNMRADGSSKFRPGKQWAVFPSFSAGWRISSEPFMEGIERVDNLKIRGSYGLIGTQSGIWNYNELSLLPYATYIINNQLAQGVTQGSMIDENLTWETTLSTNIGFDLDIDRNNWSITGDYFWKETDGMLYAVPVPISSGLGTSSTVIRNAGSVRNQGFEFTATRRGKKGNFWYDLTGAITYENTKIVSLGIVEYLTGGDTQYYGEGLTRSEVGQSIGAFFGYVMEGIYQIGDTDIPLSLQPGDVRYKDLNGDGKITAQDRTFIGKPVPDFTFGLTFNAGYKNIDFSIFFQGVQGNQVFHHNRYHTEPLARAFNQSVKVLEAWTPENPSNTMPRYTDQHTHNYALPSSRFIEDGSYLRLQNITIGYSLPNRWMGKSKIQQFRLYGSAQNVITFTRYSGFDPEVSTIAPGWRSDKNQFRGIDDSVYPLARTLVAGLEISF